MRTFRRSAKPLWLMGCWSTSAVGETRSKCFDAGSTDKLHVPGETVNHSGSQFYHTVWVDGAWRQHGRGIQSWLFVAATARKWRSNSWKHCMLREVGHLRDATGLPKVLFKFQWTKCALYFAHDLKFQTILTDFQPERKKKNWRCWCKSLLQAVLHFNCAKDTSFTCLSNWCSCTAS